MRIKKQKYQKSLSGFHTKVCLPFSVVQALKGGYAATHIITDPVAGRSQFAHRTPSSAWRTWGSSQHGARIKASSGLAVIPPRDAVVNVVRGAFD
jgi:hypothetical protein